MTEEEHVVRTLRLDESGLARIFGELEARIVEALWELENGTVHQVCRQMGDEPNYKTVMTVMNRLVDKGLLVRKREGRAFVYRVAEDQETFLAHVSRQVVGGLLTDFGERAVVGLVEALTEVGPEQLAVLRQLIDEQLEEDE
jgi:predicted transcriptional regulator